MEERVGDFRCLCGQEYRFAIGSGAAGIWPKCGPHAYRREPIAEPRCVRCGAELRSRVEDVTDAATRSFPHRFEGKNGRMPETVRVGFVRVCDGETLAEALERYGLASEVVVADGAYELVVRYPDDECERLCRDVGYAIEGWLAESSLPLVPVRVGAREYLLRPPAE